jgi:phage terminase large subunit-like protein
MICNEFAVAEETFIDMDWWDQCVTCRPVVADTAMPIWIAVDASVKHDTTALVACTWDKQSKRVRLVNHRIFRPSPDQPLDFEGTIEQTLLEWKARFRLRAVYYDPFQMASVSQRLMRRGITMVEFPQTVPNLTSIAQNLYELVKSQDISVYADDDLRLAVQRCTALETSRGWRIAKEKQSHKIDVVIALAMAAYAAVQSGERSFHLVNGYPLGSDGLCIGHPNPAVRSRDPAPTRINVVRNREEWNALRASGRVNSG